MTDRELISEQYEYKEGSAPAVASEPPKTLRQELRSSGLWSLGFGAFNIFSSSSSSGFGAVLCIIGLASLYVPSAAMFVAIGVSFAWAALSNLLLIPLGEYGGIFWAIVQVPVAYNMIRKFGRYRQSIKADQFDSMESTQQPKEKSPILFPVSGCLVSAVSMPGLLLSFLLIGLLVGPDPTAEPPGLLLFAADLFVNLGVLSIGLGLASLLSGYRFKLLSLATVMAGILPVLVRVYFILAN